MQNVCRVNVLESTQYLVQKIANVLVADRLRLEELVQVGFHETLHNVDILHLIDIGRSDDVLNIDYLKTGDDFKPFSSLNRHVDELKRLGRALTFSCLNLVRILISRSVR